jgi:hypothetical protein
MHVVMIDVQIAYTKKGLQASAVRMSSTLVTAAAATDTE